MKPVRFLSLVTQRALSGKDPEWEVVPISLKEGANGFLQQQVGPSPREGGQLGSMELKGLPSCLRSGGRRGINPASPLLGSVHKMRFCTEGIGDGWGTARRPGCRRQPLFTRGVQVGMRPPGAADLGFYVFRLRLGRTL